ncbi:MAG TPA: S9 family peptidase [Stackebrandtia sp.]|jgi:oligopeptidase B|uniref:S9 family peptidase n=1 Tax=Stackebrandtia sp. TaxID=2023065 RepID=UPI002D2D8229|nr:S9 family peptidase [Stackebrandtia sp.]HZE42081.1 S9 family peptidase [Stackebrandtia sp.]
MPQPPSAKRVDHARTHHGDTVNDPYFWLRDADNPDTIAYLKAENEFTKDSTDHLDGLRKTIFGEIKNRTQETDLSVPSRKGDWWYYTRTEEGKQYGIHCRVAATGDTPPRLGDGAALPGEEVLLDGNALAEGHDFFSLGVFDLSCDANVLAYGVDFAGNERFTLRFKDLRSGEDLPDVVEGVFYGGAWSAAGDYFFYTTVDEAWRPDRVWRHRIGSSEEDEMVYEEADERFWTGIELSRSEEYLFCESHSKITSEIRYLSAAEPTGEFRVFGEGRRPGVEVSVDHQGGRFLVLHNDGAENFALGWTTVDDTSTLRPLLEHRDDTRLESVSAFARHVVVHLRRDGLTGIRILPTSGADRDITFDEPIYSVHPASNPDYHTRMLRLSYQSLVSPESVYDYDIAGDELLLRKRKPVLGDFDPSHYEQRREWATAADGTKVPISMMYRAGATPDGTAPCLLYGYGSYETSIDPYFSIARLSLVDRGAVFAIAHIRGGGEMGRSWYDNGKLLAKKNTFTDFVDCADHMVKSGWSSADKLVARGGSAGGLLMGAMLNLAPERFAGVCAEVPFVDALNTILDPTLPLTVIEWDEWGDPLHNADVYEYMKSYTPYENIANVDYPPILAVTSLNDTRVGFHEPAKWIARLRRDAHGGPFLLKTEMEAGHGGRSGRYDAWEEESFNLAWILERMDAA